MWTYIISELSGTEIGEIIHATERTLSLGLNRPATAAFTVRANNPMVPSLFSGDRLLKIYEGSTLRFHGYVISCELAGSSDGTSVRVTAIDPAWKLSKRLLGISKGGENYTGDKAKSARKMIIKLNSSVWNSHTGIKLLPEASYFAASGTYIAGPYRPALSCINDLAHTLDGFDWYISPLEGNEIVTIESWSVPLLGQFEANNNFGTSKGTVFEYGGGQHNIRTINYIRDLRDVANIAYHLPNDMEKEEPLTELDVLSINERGFFETTADAFGITDSSLRLAWLKEFIRVNKNPRNVVSMTLDIDDGTGRVPKLGTDYWLGDLVTARSYLPDGGQLFSGQVRVYGVEIAIAESGTSTITPIFLDEEGESL